METIKHKTRIDWWIALILIVVGAILPLCLVLGVFLGWYEKGEEVIIWITAVFTFGLILIIFVSAYFGTYYELNEKGLTVRNPFFYKKTVLYDDILLVEKSVNIINRPKTWAAALSVVGVRIDYKKDSKETWFFITPKNREEFIQQLQDRV